MTGRVRQRLVFAVLVCVVVWSATGSGGGLGEAWALEGSRWSDHLGVFYPFTEGTGAVVSDQAPASAKGGAVWNTELHAAKASWLAEVSGSSPVSGLGAEPAGVLFNTSCTGAPSCDVAGVYDTSASPTVNVGSVVPRFAGSRAFSLEFWIRTDDITQVSLLLDVSSQETALVASGCDTNTKNFRSFMVRQDGDQVTFVMVDRTSSISPRTCITCTSSAGALVAGALTHVVITAPETTGDALGMWINNQAQTCSAVTLGGDLESIWELGAADRSLAIGGRFDGEDLWVGRLYLFAMYFDAINSTHVATNYAAGPYNYPPEPVSQTVQATEDISLLIQLNGTDPYDDTSLFTATVTSVAGLGAAGALHQVTDGTMAIGSEITGATAVTNTQRWVAWVPAADVNGAAAASFTFAIEDAETSSDSDGMVIIDVAAVDDQPALTVAAPTAALVYGSSVSLPGLTVSEADGDEIVVVVQATSGLVTFGVTTGIAFDVGDGVDDTGVMFRGNLADVNAALASLSYASLLELGGVDVVTITVNDDNGGVASSGDVTVTVTGNC